MENFITLSALQGHLRAVIEQYAGGAQWVVAEISECKVNYAGHCYLELVERPDNGKAPVAQARAVIWASSYKMISGYFRFQTGSDISAGMKVLVKCTVSYHPVYGLSLVISDIDPAYTLGETERLRRQTIAQLQEEGVFEMNKDFELPDVLQRIAVISSPKAAGYRDFMQELNASPYRFDVKLFASVMQGDAAEGSIVDALDAVAETGDEFDAVVIIRGGGSTSDLGCFDNYRLCAYIAQFPLPVVTGIGHDKDVSVADMVAHTSLKTPTAVAAFLVGRAAEMHARIEDLYEETTGLAQQMLMMEANRLENAGLLLASRTTGLLHGGLARLDKLKEGLRFAAGERLAGERRLCSSFGTSLSQYSTQRLAAGQAWAGYAGQRLRAASEGMLSRRKAQLELLEVSVEGMSPKRILSRGYALVRGVRSAAAARVGQRVEIELHDGTMEADIISKSIHKNNG
ncbi:MAG: exodeoxyribonuclease VII large subunit [Rikenellaceae bacterium]|nr:exodeoxyribonuclease VII large subunit [Rikenellaceae bacterium]